MSKQLSQNDCIRVLSWYLNLNFILHLEDVAFSIWKTPKLEERLGALQLNMVNTRTLACSQNSRFLSYSCGSTATLITGILPPFFRWMLSSQHNTEEACLWSSVSTLRLYFICQSCEIEDCKWQLLFRFMLFGPARFLNCDSGPTFK